MFKIQSLKKTISHLTVIAVAGVLTSCGGDKVDHANFIPANSCAVLSINTDQIFSDAMFDLMSNTDITEGIATGPLAKLMEDPANAGLVRFDRYYLFGTGANVMESRLGAVMPMSDPEKLKEYLTTNFELEVTKDSIYSVAEISNDNVIVWDENAAILMYGPFGGDLVNDAIDCFVQKETSTLAKSDKTFNEALKDGSHIVGWFKNDDLINNLDFGIANATQFQLMKTLNIKKEDIKDSKSIFSFNFLDGKITMDSKQFMNDKQKKLYEDLGKPNSIAPLLAATSSENPVAMVSTSLKTEGLLNVLKEYRLDDAFDQMLKRANSPVKLKLDYIVNFFEGDALILVNDFTEIKKNKMVPKLNDEGEYVAEVVEVKEKVPAVTIALPVKDENQLNLVLPFAVKGLPVVDGVYNYNNEAYITVREGVLFIANSPKGVEAIKAMTGKLNPRLTTLATTHRVASFLDLKRAFEFAGEGLPMAKPISDVAGNYLADVVVTEKGIDETGAVIGKSEINFSSKEHSLITTIKFSDEMSKAIKPFLSLVM